MKRIKLLLFVLLCFLGANAVFVYSIDIKGRVIDARTREALPFVNVTIYGKPDVGSATDVDGTFTITGVKPGIFRLVASI